jgi:GT2 family glycosyltransferase
MDLSIVIVSWNTSEILTACLRSIYENAPTSSFEIWVVDNASKDDTVEKIKSNFPDIRLIENATNMGFAGGNNQALSLCQGKYLLLLNPDTLVYPNSLQNLIDFMDANPEAGACGSRYLNPDGTLQPSSFPIPTLPREFWRLFHIDKIKKYGVYDMNTWSIDQPRQVDVLQGACLIIRNTVLEKIGLLDTDYYIYTEEVDLCYRIRQAGWKLYWLPTSVIVHFGGQSTSQVADAMFLRLYESKIIFIRKHYGKLQANIYKLILALSSLVRIIPLPVMRIIVPKRQEFYQTISKNYRNLLLELPKM